MIRLTALITGFLFTTNPSLWPFRTADGGFVEPDARVVCSGAPTDPSCGTRVSSYPFMPAVPEELKDEPYVHPLCCLDPKGELIRKPDGDVLRFCAVGPPCPAPEVRRIIEVLPRRLGLKSIQFDSGSAKLPVDPIKDIDQEAKVLIEHPEIELIDVDGNTDPEEDPRVGEARANVVAERLVHDGIDRLRLEVYGSGANRPIASNKTLAGRATNRRVDLIPSERLKR